MVMMPKQEPFPEAGPDPFIGFPDMPVVSPWREPPAAPGEKPPTKRGRPSSARPADQDDYPEYYLG